MKRLLLAVVGIMFAATIFAQNGLVASLSHGETITYFYGVTALQQAVAQADDGDIINLSDGSFKANNMVITKAITLRGAGIDSKAPTYIVDNFTIEIPSDVTQQFMIEGIRCANKMVTKGKFSDPYFVKCQFNEVSNAKETDVVTNIMFADCKITGFVNVGGSDTYSFVNCFVNEITQYEAGAATLSNCVIEKACVVDVRQCQLFNCIIVSPNGANWVLPNNTQATNCICINYPQNIFRDVIEKTNCTTANFADVFKTFTGTYSDTETFELTDDFANAEIVSGSGVKGKELGLYGGLLPYNSTPSYPLITTMTVDKQTTTDGQLGVTIEVNK